ncbi:hypothetical protein A1O1_04286 [Capronia coronata CBS 617.96]|uniref:ATP phosphoribosyltransferase n=1 Tax=Capronia coronata CBS 617.96 TaxID=1182541 RepID=W9YE71_9EURO|nr:uncharacterized protein A1O1_04286 [Capronia coronata CBS 617.96]EXJ91177.1 hypothetical protein A1O1_04286 [Capronia coronata CBS 617.96]
MNNNNNNTSNTSNTQLYQLTFYVPQTHTKQCIDALFSVGAGTWPNPNPDVSDDADDKSGSTSEAVSLTVVDQSQPKYINTCFVSSGTGQFQPTAAANPHIGTAGGQVEYVQEDRVEMVISGGKGKVERTVRALKSAHPYEVVAFFVAKSEFY